MTALRAGTELGRRFVTLWSLQDGSLMRTPMTEQEYRALALPGAGAPARPAQVPASARWRNSYETWLVDTPSGGPEDGVVMGNLLFWIRKDGVLDAVEVEVAQRGGGGPLDITLDSELEPGVTVVNGEIVRA